MEDIPRPPLYPLTEDNRAALVVVAALVFLIYAVLGLIIKLLIRLNITAMRDFDVILLVGTVFYVGQTACVMIASNNGLGQHQDAISMDEFEIYSKSMYSARILALFVLACAKISVCLLIQQINNQGLFSKVNIGLACIIVGWTISGVMATIFECPMPEPWLATSPEQCPRIGKIYVYNGVMNILTDIALCVLPVFMMWDVQTTWERKTIVMALFGTRIVVPIVTIPTIVSAGPLFDSSPDSTWLAVSSTIWFQISLGLSVLMACIPSLKGVIDSLLGATAAATIHAPYELRGSTKRSGFTVTRVTDSKQNSSGGRGLTGGSSGHSGGRKASAKRRSAALATWDDTDHHTSASHARNESPSGSESVRKLTEGVIVVQDEVEVLYDSRAGATTFLRDSRESSDGGYHRM